MPEHFITQSDTGKRIMAGPGDIITIQLPENPTTGFQWAIDQVDEGVLSLERSEFTLPIDPSIGSGGTRLMTFHANRAGNTNIRLKNWRAWEGDQSVTQRFEIEVHVRT